MLAIENVVLCRSEGVRGREKEWGGDERGREDVVVVVSFFFFDASSPLAALFFFSFPFFPPPSLFLLPTRPRQMVTPSKISAADEEAYLKEHHFTVGEFFSFFLSRLFPFLFCPRKTKSNDKNKTSKKSPSFSLRARFCPDGSLFPQRRQRTDLVN